MPDRPGVRGNTKGVPETGKNVYILPGGNPAPAAGNFN